MFFPQLSFVYSLLSSIQSIHHRHTIIIDHHLRPIVHTICILFLLCLLLPNDWPVLNRSECTAPLIFIIDIWSQSTSSSPSSSCLSNKTHHYYDDLDVSFSYCLHSLCLYSTIITIFIYIDTLSTSTGGCHRFRRPHIGQSSGCTIDHTHYGFSQFKENLNW